MPPPASPMDPTGNDADESFLMYRDDDSKPSVAASDASAAAASSSGYASLKVVELKRRLQQRGISFADYVEKDDLVKRLESCAPVATTAADAFDDSGTAPGYSTMKVADLKRRLQQRGIAFADCIEKSELIHRLRSNEKTDNGAKRSSSPGKEKGGRVGGGAHPFFSAGYTTKKATASASAAARANAARHPNRDPLGPLADGESKTVPGSKPGHVWTVHRKGLVYHCYCPTWKFQQNAKSSEQRKCKHIDSMRAGYAPLPPVEKSKSKKKRAATTTPKNKSNSKNAKTSSDTDDDMSDAEDFLKVTLAEKWDETKQDPTGYYLSEKLDGMRCVLKDGKLWSRNGKPIYAPEYFMDALPINICLDGELFGGRQEFQSLMSIKSNPHDERWSQVRYLVYDAPLVPGSFPVRLQALQHALSTVPSNIAKVLEQTVCTGKAQVEERLECVLSLGGEGVMLKKAEPEYANGRSKNLLKVKKFHDADAIVLEHEPGKGRMGALKCKMMHAGSSSSPGKIFKIGTGFSDAEREEPPPVGSTVSYKYQELTKDGIPRFPTYLRERPVE